MHDCLWRISAIDKTHFTVVNSPKILGRLRGLEYEAAWALGAANGVGDIEALQYANLLCNEDRDGPDFVRCDGGRGDGTL